MSEEQLKAFMAKVQADTSLQEQLKAEGVDIVAIAKAAGFCITADDLNIHRQNLSNAELEVLAGGQPQTVTYNCGRCAYTLNTIGCNPACGANPTLGCAERTE